MIPKPNNSILDSYVPSSIPRTPYDFYKSLEEKFLGIPLYDKTRMDLEVFTKSFLKSLHYNGEILHVPNVSVNISINNPTVLEIWADGEPIYDWIEGNYIPYNEVTSRDFKE